MLYQRGRLDDNELLDLSVTALVIFHLDVVPMSCFIPGWQADHDQPERLVRRVCGLLKSMPGEDDRTDGVASRASCSLIRSSRP